MDTNLHQIHQNRILKVWLLNDDDTGMVNSQDDSHRILGGYHRHVERPTETVNDEVTPVMQWKANARAWLDGKVEGDSVAHEADYRSRIAALHEMAEDEGITVGKAPIEDFWKLIDSLSPRIEAQLVLSDEGNLIATWKDSSGNYFDIEFLGDNNLQYVVFKESCRQFNTTISGISDSIHEVQGYELRENSHKILLDNENSGEGDSTIQDIKLYVQEYGQESLLGI